MTKYVIITPARDEEKHIEHTILSVVGQTVLPAQWIIVNDGSSDATGAIIDRYAELHPWITAWHRSNRGFRQAGGGVINAFNEGYAQIKSWDWDFIVKLDADLGFASDYFESCFGEFQKDGRLGIAGGGIYHLEKDSLKLESGPVFHVRGATKIYRRECWDRLGGLLPAPGWDTIDEVKANMLGWSTRTLPDLKLLHYRFTGSADGAWRDSVKSGLANYITGYHPLFMLVKCARHLTLKRHLVGSLGLSWGFLKGYYTHAPQVQDPTLIAYTRSQQLRRLLCLESIWR
ncbi:MAG: glycosyltransferase family A protein [Candidatus Acidiferrales bacterium]